MTRFRALHRLWAYFFRPQRRISSSIIIQNKINETIALSFTNSKQNRDTLPTITNKIADNLYALIDPNHTEIERLAIHSAISFTRCLNKAAQVKTLYQIAQFRWIILPTELDSLFPPQLRDAIDSLKQIGDTVDRAMETTAQLTKTTTLWEVSEQIVHLTRAQFALKELGEGFAPVLALVIGHFADVLKEEGERVRTEQQRGPVPNPYVTGNPVHGQLFVGREDVLRRLEAVGFEVVSVRRCCSTATVEWASRRCCRIWAV